MADFRFDLPGEFASRFDDALRAVHDLVGDPPTPGPCESCGTPTAARWHTDWNACVPVGGRWFHECARCREARERSRLSRPPSPVSRFSPRHAGADLNGARPANARHAAMIDRVRLWCRHSLAHPSGRPWLILTGGPGTGKTWALCAASNALFAGGVAHRIMHFGALVDRIKRGAFAEGATETLDSAAARFADLPILIDDLGTRRALSTWDREALDEFFDAAYRRGTPLMLTTNLDRTQIADYLGARFTDRRWEVGDVIECAWPSLRCAPLPNPGAIG